MLVDAAEAGRIENVGDQLGAVFTVGAGAIGVDQVQRLTSPPERHIITPRAQGHET